MITMSYSFACELVLIVLVSKTKLKLFLMVRTISQTSDFFSWIIYIESIRMVILITNLQTQLLSTLANCVLAYVATGKVEARSIVGPC